MFSVRCPSLSRFGRQAYWTIGGGPHRTIRASAAGAGRWSLIMSWFTKPELYLQSERKEGKIEIRHNLLKGSRSGAVQGENSVPIFVDWSQMFGAGACRSCVQGEVLAPKPQPVQKKFNLCKDCCVSSFLIAKGKWRSMDKVIRRRSKDPNVQNERAHWCLAMLNVLNLKIQYFCLGVAVQVVKT